MFWHYVDTLHSMTQSNELQTHERKSSISNHIVWHGGQVTAVERSVRMGQKPVTIWLTGLSGSGKSTIAYALERRLLDYNRLSYVLDGDNVRHGLNRDLGFSPEDRTENIRRIAEVAALMNDSGLIVITAFISPYQADREMGRKIIGSEFFKEVHIATPLSICEERDPKGLYRRARSGEVPAFTGISAPYEPPVSPDACINTETCSIDECVNILMSLIAPFLIPREQNSKPTR